MKIASIADVKAHFSAYLKASEAGPVIITRNDKPATVLVNVEDEVELEGLLVAYSPKFRAILQAARAEIQVTGGIPHDVFWQQVHAEYEHAPSNGQARSEVKGKARKGRKSVQRLDES